MKTEEQINRAIAETCGICHADEYGPLYKTSEGWVANCPNYYNDLNAMHEAEKTLSRVQFDDYVARLFDAYYEATVAPARVRAKEFLKTLDKWEDS